MATERESAVDLLQLLSKQLDPRIATKDKLKSSPNRRRVYRKETGGDDEELGESPSEEELHERFEDSDRERNGYQNFDSQRTEQRQNNYFESELERLRLEYSKDRSELEVQLEQLREDNRLLQGALRRSKAKEQELAASYQATLEDMRHSHEEIVEQIQSDKEALKRRYLKDLYDAEQEYNHKIQDVQTSYEDWANELEESTKQRLRLAEEERYKVLVRCKQLENDFDAVEGEKMDLKAECDRLVMELEIKLRDLQLENEKRFKADRQQWSLDSRRRVAQALESLPL